MQKLKLLEDNTGENLGDLGFGDEIQIKQKHNPVKKRYIPDF